MSWDEAIGLKAFPTEKRLRAVLSVIELRVPGARLTLCPPDADEVDDEALEPASFHVLVKVAVARAAEVLHELDPDDPRKRREVQAELEPPPPSTDLEAAAAAGCVDASGGIRDWERFQRVPADYTLAIDLYADEPADELVARVEVGSNERHNRVAWPLAFAFAEAIAKGLGVLPDRSLN